MIFEADSRNSDQKCLDVTSVSSDVTPLVLGAVKDSESTVDISVQPSVRGRLSSVLISGVLCQLLSSF